MHRKDVIIDGKRLPSVTEVLSWPPPPWLERWKAKWGVLAERKTAAACAIGNEFDSKMEEFLWGVHNGEPVRYRRTRNMLYNVCVDFVGRYSFRPEVTQYHVISKKYGYHGTLDAIGAVSERQGLVIVDWKTSAAIYDHYELQLAAYAKAYEENTGLKITCGFIVCVSKDRPNHAVKIREVKLTKSLFNKFLVRLKKYNERGKNECLPTH